MIRTFMRLLGLLCLAAGFIFLVYDGTRSIADQTLRLTPFEQSWSDVHQTSLNGLRPAFERHLPAWAWEYGLAPVLRQPTWAVLGGLGIILMLVFRRPRPLIGYSRD